nr:hypothetical protein [uncultured Desulfobacter sp.]
MSLFSWLFHPAACHLINLPTLGGMLPLAVREKNLFFKNDLKEVAQMMVDSYRTTKAIQWRKKRYQDDSRGKPGPDCLDEATP